jgi:hemerythrin
MTANVFREDVEKCLEVGMNDHVGKPLDLEEVMAMLRKYLTKRFDDTSERVGGDTTWKQGVAWMPELETGNAAIDSQHKQLFNLTSDLVNSCIDGKSADTLGKTLGFLVDYTVKHFADEEALQLEYDFPDYEHHKKLHDDFKVTVGQLVEKFESDGSSKELADDVNSIVVRWLVQHIKTEDSKIAAHIRKQNGAGA